METVIFRAKSKKDMNLLIQLAKKIDIEVEKLSSSTETVDENSAAYELKVEKNLMKIMDESRTYESVSYDEVKKY